MAKKKQKDKRSEAVRFMVRESEKASYEWAAGICDSTVSDWVRRLLNAEVERLRESQDK